MSRNVGVGTAGSAHSSDWNDDPYSHLGVGKIQWPLKFQTTIKIDKEQVMLDRRDFFRIRMIGLKRKLKKFFT